MPGPGFAGGVLAGMVGGLAQQQKEAELRDFEEKKDAKQKQWAAASNTLQLMQTIMLNGTPAQQQAIFPVYKEALEAITKGKPQDVAKAFEGLTQLPPTPSPLEQQRRQMTEQIAYSTTQQQMQRKQQMAGIQKITESDYFKQLPPEDQARIRTILEAEATLGRSLPGELLREPTAKPKKIAWAIDEQGRYYSFQLDDKNQKIAGTENYNTLPPSYLTSHITQGQYTWEDTTTGKVMSVPTTKTTGPLHPEPGPSGTPNAAPPASQGQVPVIPQAAVPGPRVIGTKGFPKPAKPPAVPSQVRSELQRAQTQLQDAENLQKNLEDADKNSDPMAATVAAVKLGVSEKPTPGTFGRMLGSTAVLSKEQIKAAIAAGRRKVDQLRTAAQDRQRAYDAALSGKPAPVSIANPLRPYPE